MFRLLVAGGRDFYDYQFIERALDNWFNEKLAEDPSVWEDGIILVHGDASGVDRIAAQWAKYNLHIPEPHPADWNKGKGAGPIRNAEMIESGLDYAILFPGGRGTANMKSQLVKANIPFHEVLDSQYV